MKRIVLTYCPHYMGKMSRAVSIKMSNIRSARLSLTLAIAAAAVGAVLLVSAAEAYGQSESRGWRVWVREEPCSGRFDWLSVAREHQGGGLNVYAP